MQEGAAGRALCGEQVYTLTLPSASVRTSKELRMGNTQQKRRDGGDKGLECPWGECIF